MKTLIIYMSIHHGNTKKIAEKIGEVLGAELKKPNEVKPDELGNYDLVGFGSGIYFGKFHALILKFIDSLPDMAGKGAFVFSTHGSSMEGYNKGFIKILTQKKFKVLGDYDCQGFDTFGPFKLIGGLAKGHPNENDLKRAGEFAEKLLV